MTKKKHIMPRQPGTRSPFAPDGMLRPALKLIGAKVGQKIDSTRSKVYAIIESRFGPRHHFYDVFMGSGAVMIGKPVGLGEEICNDINAHPINFYRCMRKDQDLLMHYIQRHITDMSHEKFDFLKTKLAPVTEKNRFTQAALFYIVCKFARNGIVRYNKSGENNSTFCMTTEGRGILYDEWSNLLVKRIKRVKFTRLDFREFLATQVKPLKSSVVFLDPPYHDVFTMYDRIKFSDKDHEDMAAILKKAPYSWILTINDTEFIRKIYKGAFIVENEVHWCCSNTNKGRGKKVELIISSFKYDPKITHLRPDQGSN